MEFTAQQIADFLQGEIQGDASVKVSDFSKIEEGRKGTLSFLSNPKYNHYIYESEASLILVNRDFEPEFEVKATLIKVDNAYESLAKLLTFVERSKEKKTGISELASIAPSAKIGENVYIAPFVVVDENAEIGNNVVISSHCSIGEDVKIGNDVHLHTGVKICSKCVIEDNCIFHAGVVIGSDGFGFAPTGDGSYQKIPQTGNVIIESNVEIGANSTVDRATLGSTIIRKGVKIDNLVQIAHNVEIGENTVIASQSGVAGSTKVGKNCVFAGQVGIAGHLQIADGSIFGAKTGVPNSIKQPNMAHQGYPAIPVAIFRRSSVVYKNLPELQKIIYDLQRRINELEEKVNRNA
jgi:UDP-3-O-[3-hydroxymyristoyl] glucosamine N-acyltransferase